MGPIGEPSEESRWKAELRAMGLPPLDRSRGLDLDRWQRSWTRRKPNEVHAPHSWAWPAAAVAVIVVLAALPLLNALRHQMPIHPTGPPTSAGAVHRVSPSSPLIVENHLGHGATDIWLDGFWKRGALYGPRYVIAFMGTDRPLIEVYNEDETPYVRGVQWNMYQCPGSIGALRITSITDAGMLVHFVARDAHGTLNLKTKVWHIAAGR